MDHLEEMLTKQLEFQRRLGYDFPKMTVAERIRFVKDMYIAAMRELGEALDEVSWKPWTVGERFNTTAFTSELSDAWQFIANLWFAAMPTATPREIAFAMRATLDVKILINEKRRVEGYDGVSTKCSICGRATDDPNVACRPEIAYCSEFHPA
jgi:dUTPase